MGWNDLLFSLFFFDWGLKWSEIKSSQSITIILWFCSYYYHFGNVKITFSFIYIFRRFLLRFLNFIFFVFSYCLKKGFLLWSMSLHHRRKKHACKTAKLKNIYYNTFHVSWDAPHRFHQEKQRYSRWTPQSHRCLLGGRFPLLYSSFSESLHHSFSGSKSTTFFFIFELLCMKFFFFFWDCMCEWIWLILLFIKKAWFRFLKNFLCQTKPILCKEQKVSDANLIFVFYIEIECFNSSELSLPRERFFIRWLKSQKLCNLFLVILYLLVLKWNKSVSFEILGLPF